MIGVRIGHRRTILIANSIADHPVGMAYLLGNWPTDHQATSIAGQLDDRRFISSIFDISPSTGRSATVVARQQVGVVVNRLVGMGL